MHYAVLKTGGKQYKVEEGQIIAVEKIESDQEKIEFDNILLLVSDGKIKVGKPMLKAKVLGQILEQAKGEKIKVFKYKAK
ncbi:MAG: 50S ribosomal protein L21, partial [Candidatus Woykebacteria bacterium RBG_13_40_7b]